MIGERENIDSNANYGALVMRSFNIDGNEINAFYDKTGNLVFVLDNTVNDRKTNVLLVINTESGKKWDEILSGKYGVDLEAIRPKFDNKYQKLDIEYSGLSVYENLIHAYEAEEDLQDSLEQLEILRDSAVRSSAMMRLTVANETISKTNITIIKTKESIVKLQNRAKSLRAKLNEAKKEIGRVETKQSASKILKLESQIETVNEKIKRSKKRLESAQKRLESATADAELATMLLNQPAITSKPVLNINKEQKIKTMPEIPVTKYENGDESELKLDEDIEEINEDIKPLFDEDPQILNEDIAFKPIEFEAPVFSETNMNEAAAPVLNMEQENKSVLDSMMPITEQNTPTVSEDALSFQPIVPPEITEEKNILETLSPVVEQNIQPVENNFVPQPVVEPEIIKERPVLETLNPVTEQNVETYDDAVATQKVVEPGIKNNDVLDNVHVKEHSKNGPLYYVLLFVLIILSVFTLWLYQKNMSTDTAPVLTAKTSESAVVSEPAVVEEDTVVDIQPVEEPQDDEFYESAFIEEETVVAEPEIAPVVEEVINTEVAEPDVIEQEVVVDEAPVVMDVIPERLNTMPSGDTERMQILSEEDVLATKPVYDTGAKSKTVFVDEQEYEPDSEVYYEDDPFYDVESAAYAEE